jgi:MFS transporter, DHA1 family, tetracycline resistance protein
VPVLLLIVCMSLIGFGIVMPLLPFFATAFDAEPWQVTLLFSAYSAGQFAGELFWGRLSDRIGRRPVLLITITASALTYVAFAFAPGIWIAILVRAAGGFVSGYMSVIQAYIVDVTPPERLAGRLGWVGSAFGFGFAIGPALGGVLARSDMGATGFRPPLILAAVLCLLAAAGILAFVRESLRPGVSAAPKANPLTALGEALRR